MSWTRRSVGLLVAAAIVTSVAACTADSGDAASVCVAAWTYQDITYRDVGTVEFTLGKKLGVATSTPCDDNGGRGKNEEPAGVTETAYEVDGISPKVAIAVGDTPGTARFFAFSPEDSEFPPEVQKLIDRS